MSSRPKALPRNYPCPCRSEESGDFPYARCCQPWHDGLAAGVHAPTPEALMRSRYSAYVIGLIDYLLATWHASTAPGELELSPVKWLGLEVRQAAQTGDAAWRNMRAPFRPADPVRAARIAAALAAIAAQKAAE